VTEPLGDPEPAAPPPPGPAGARRRLPLAALVIVAGLVLVGAAVGVGVALSGPPKTGAACLVGDWHSDGIRVGLDTVAPGSIDASFRSDGTGENHVVAREDADNRNTVTDKIDFTFHYTATDTTIAYTQADGTVSSADPTGDGTPLSQHVTQLSNDTYTCSGDRLTIGGGDPGPSQSLTRR
jgi:hypothetical protein